VDKTAADPLVGRLVAQYEVVARLGGGGMGVVYAARDTRLGRRVALKFLPPQWSHDESAKQRFIREAQAASATDHPNICTVHDIASTDDGQLFIVMAHYEGETLKQRLERGRLAVDEAIDIAAQVAEGLAKAHAQGVIHRDIKPGNLMLTEDGVRILDFGLAKFSDARLKLTLEGSTIGTIAYMSPEQVRGEDADARSDVWATGVVLYEMVAGNAPFRGGYPEAISHAIRHDTPAPLRAAQPEVPEALEQLAFRALHKDPNVRFQTARDLARALRRLQGRTLPLDLRTEMLPPVDLPSGVRRRPWWTTRRGAAAAAGLAALLIGTPLWVLSPVERVPVAVAPVVNQTGYAELDPYRLALTQELTAQLADSRLLRVLPYDRLLQIVRRFRQGGGDVSSREAMQAIAQHSGAGALVVPTLLYEGGAWQARVEIRDPRTATNSAVYETVPVVSSLLKDTVHGLIPTVAERIEGHFINTGPWRASLAARIRTAVGRTPARLTSRMRTLDVAAAFEQAMEAYDQLEYAAALRAVTAASEGDPRNAVLLAWRSRVAAIIRKDDDAAEAGGDALRLLDDQMPERDRLFVSAIAAESRRDFPTAEERYRDLVESSVGDAWPVMELAGYLDRRAMPRDAVATYRQALVLDGRLVRARLELCRLYNQLNEAASAKEEAQLARTQYTALGDRAGEAQALLCATDTLRSGSDPERQEAYALAQKAADIFKQLHATYNLPRAYYYLGMVAGMMGNPAQAITFNEQALKAAQAGDNIVLLPRVLNNLGVTHEAVGNWSRAVEYYQQGYKLNEALGDERTAARNRVNAGAIVIEYGGNLAEGVREVENALAVFRKIGDKNFEAFCLQLLGVYDRYAGRLAEADRRFNQALAIARERDLKDLVASLTMDLARVRFDIGDYARARDLLLQALGQGPWSKDVEARIRLALAYARLGDTNNATVHLNAVSGRVQRGTDPALFQLLKETAGEVAYEAGRLTEARTLFAESVNAGTGDLPNAGAVEARARLGLLDALAGAVDGGRAAIRASLNRSQTMGRFTLEARCRVYLARIDVTQGRFEDALQILRDIPADGDRALGPEVQSQVHFWRGRALAGVGNAEAARKEGDVARRLANDLRTSLPDAARRQFAARPDFRLIGIQ